jgi:hypothetical protein
MNNNPLEGLELFGITPEGKKFYEKLNQKVLETQKTKTLTN